MDSLKVMLVCALLLVAMLSIEAARVYPTHEQVQAASEAEAAEAAEPRVRRDHHEGVTGPVHTFVKTDKHANFKWGVRHHVGHHYG